jgi:ATP-dependent DNA helicase RecQ
MLLPGATLILSPLIALMKDQAENLPPAVAEHTTFINSSLEFGEVGRRIRMIASGRTKLVYAAPERLRQPPFLHALRQAGVSMVVVDEAHCISQWGHDFRPDYRAVGRAVETLAPPVVLAVTATATPLVRDDIERQLGRKMHRIVRPTFRDNLHLVCRHVDNEKEKLTEVVRLCREEEGTVLVYCGTRDKCEEIAGELERRHISAGFYHAGLPAEERAATQDRFMSGDIRVMAATVAFGMGVDKSDIRALVHYHPSKTLENYYQEAGRAGRDGERSNCTLLFSRADAAGARRFLRDNEIGIDDLKAVYQAVRAKSVAITTPTGEPSKGRIARASWEELVNEVLGGENVVRTALPLLEEVALVRRHTDIPRSFQLFPQAGLTPNPIVAQASLPVSSALSAVADQGGAWSPAELSAYTGIPWPDLEFSLLRAQDDGILAYRTAQRDMLIEILPSPVGARDLMTEMLQHRTSEAEHRMNAMLGYARANQCRHAVIGRYFGDHPSAGKCGMCDVCDGTAKPFTFERRQPTYERKTVRQQRTPVGRRYAGVESDDVPDSDEALFAALREWRSATAKEEKVPGYCVFNDNVLRALAAEKPSSEIEMLSIAGIGPRKADKYGVDVLRIIREGR